MSLCDRIKSAVEKKFQGTQAELAVSSGLSPQLVNAVLKGRKGDRLSALVAASICQAAGMSPEEFGKMLYQLAKK